MTRLAAIAAMIVCVQCNASPKANAVPLGVARDRSYTRGAAPPLDVDGYEIMRIDYSAVEESRRTDALREFWAALLRAVASDSHPEHLARLRLPEFTSGVQWGVCKLWTPSWPLLPFTLLLHVVEPSDFIGSDEEWVSIRFWIGLPRSGSRLIHASDDRFRTDACVQLTDALRDACTRVLVDSMAGRVDPEQTPYSGLRIWVGGKEVRAGRETN